jgi:hypothetical protein
LAELEQSIAELGGEAAAQPLIQRMLVTLQDDLVGYEAVRLIADEALLATWLHRVYGSLRVFGERSLCSRASAFERQLGTGPDPVDQQDLDTFIQCTRQWLAIAIPVARWSGSGLPDPDNPHHDPAIVSTSNGTHITQKGPHP